LVKIILIGLILFLVWLRIILSFLRDSILSNQSLKRNPLEKRFQVLLEELDRRVFDGDGILNVYDENYQYLELTGANDMNVSYNFMYSTKNLTIQIIFNGTDKIVDKTYNGLESLSDAAQVKLATIIEEETKTSFLKMH